MCDLFKLNSDGIILEILVFIHAKYLKQKRVVLLTTLLIYFYIMDIF